MKSQIEDEDIIVCEKLVIEKDIFLRFSLYLQGRNDEKY